MSRTKVVFKPWHSKQLLFNPPQFQPSHIVNRQTFVTPIISTLIIFNLKNINLLIFSTRLSSKINMIRFQSTHIWNLHTVISKDTHFWPTLTSSTSTHSQHPFTLNIYSLSTSTNFEHPLNFNIHVLSTSTHIQHPVTFNIHSL